MYCQLFYSAILMLMPLFIEGSSPRVATYRTRMNDFEVSCITYDSLLQAVDDEQKNLLPRPETHRTWAELILIKTAAYDEHNEFMEQLLERLSGTAFHAGSLSYAFYNAAKGQGKNLRSLIAFWNACLPSESLSEHLVTADTETPGIPLHAAIERFRYDNAKLLLEIAPQSVFLNDFFGRSPLYIAIDSFTCNQAYTVETASAMIMLLKKYRAENIATKTCSKPSDYALSLRHLDTSYTKFATLIDPCLANAETMPQPTEKASDQTFASSILSMVSWIWSAQ